MSDQMSSSEAEMSGENKDDSKETMEVEEEDMDESSGDEDEEDTEGQGNLQKAKQALTCRKVTLNTLMEEGIIEPGEGVLSIDYLGQRFDADLLASGKIKWHGSEEEFGTPSAWALHCKRLVNPIKRSGCGWASVKYKGKKLDIWKSVWARKHRMSPFKSPLQLPSTSVSPPAAVTSHSAPVTATVTTVFNTTEGVTSPSTMTQSNITAPSSATKIDNSSSTETPSANVDKPSINLPLSTSSPKSLSALLSTPPQDPKSSLSASLTASNTLIKSKTPECVKGPSGDVALKEDVTTFLKDSVSNSTLRKSPIKVNPELSVSVTPPSLSIHTSPPLLPAGSKRPSPSQQTSHKELANQNKANTDVVLRDRKCIRYSDLDMRTPDIDMNTLVQCEKFDNHKKLQPFSVLVSTNAMLLMDFHCHLTKSEVVGYLGGHWDSAKQILSIEQSFPVLCRFADKLQAPVVEEEIRRRMKSRKLMVVGWYHSHPYCLPQPTLRDVDCQMTYQLQMRGAGSTYHPCIGFIEAPFEKHENFLQGFWVMPNLEHPASFNIPMHISYTVRRDLSLTEDILIDMKLLSEFYSGAPDRVRFKERWKDDLSYLDKMRTSLATKLPEDQLDSGTFLDYMQQLLRDMK